MLIFLTVVFHLIFWYLQHEIPYDSANDFFHVGQLKLGPTQKSLGLSIELGETVPSLSQAQNYIDFKIIETLIGWN